jgi:pyridoxamine 5'-phosphate oxidase
MEMQQLDQIALLGPLRGDQGEGGEGLQRSIARPKGLRLLEGSEVMDFQAMRRNYTREGIDVDQVDPDPAIQFQRWFGDAEKAKPGEWFETNAMTLACADQSSGRVTARIVLLKGLEEGRPLFFTNHLSEKGTQIDANPQVALCFFWPHLERQVRIEGQATRIAPEASDAYFGSRPRGHQLGAWVSGQSQVITNRQMLEEKLLEVTDGFEGSEVPRPENWGGYRVDPSRYEFWQGRVNRLHDRIVYRGSIASGWEIVRLAP